MMSEREHDALVVGNDPTKLHKELMLTKGCLHDDFRKLFKKNRFEFANKRMLSDCGKLALQWQTRVRPDEEESYENQQTNRGVVVLVVLDKRCDYHG